MPALCLVLSCASMPMMPVNQRQAAANDQAHAENRIMKKNLDLALRENEVFKSENSRYKSEVKGLKKELASVKEELAALTETYNDDTTRLNEEIARLNESYEIMVTDFTRMAQESQQHIAELTDQNKGLQTHLIDETERLNVAIKNQKAIFETQLKTAEETLAAEKAGCNARETALQSQLTTSKQALAEKDAAIKALEQARQDAMKNQAVLEKTLQEQAEKIRDLEKTNQELTAAQKTTQKPVEEKQAIKP